MKASKNVGIDGVNTVFFLRFCVHEIFSGLLESDFASTLTDASLAV